MRLLKRLFKKRQVSVTDTSWQPYRDYSLAGVANRPYTSLGVVNQALRIYSNSCLRFPLRILNKEKQPVEHYLTRLFDRPNSFQSKGVFFSQLINNIFLTGNFHAVIKSDMTGQIKELLPFIGGSVWAYPDYNRGGSEFSDPVLIAKTGYFYRDYRARIWTPDEILHLRDPVTSSIDLLNGVSRISLARLAFESAADTQQGVAGVAQSGFCPITFIKSPKGTPENSIKSLKDKIETFYKTGRAKTRRLIKLPDAIELDKQAQNINSADFEFCKKASDLDLAKVMGIESIFSLDTSQVQSGSKEAYRSLTHSVLKPFLSAIACEFSNKLLSEGEKDSGLYFNFQTDAISSMDLREQSTYLSTLKKSGILTANECREVISFPDNEQGNHLVSEKLETEEAKLSIIKEEKNSEKF